jgi:integrase
MTHSEVVGSEWTIPAERYKTKLEHVIPLSKIALAELPDGEGYVFTTTNGKQPIGGFGKHKVNIDKASGVKGWTIHDLRRTARTLLSRAGVNADVAERCLGHVIGGVRGIYDRHEYYDEKAKAFEALASLVGRIVAGKAAEIVAIRRSR